MYHVRNALTKGVFGIYWKGKLFKLANTDRYSRKMMLSSNFSAFLENKRSSLCTGKKSFFLGLFALLYTAR